MPSTSYLPPAMNSPSANSRVSPGRNGKNSPHSTKTIARLTQRNAPPNSLEQPVGIQPLDPEQQRLHEHLEVREHGHAETVPAARGRRRAVRRTSAGSSSVASWTRTARTPSATGGRRAGAVRPDAARPRRGRRRAVGGAAGPRASSTTRRCSPRATAATSWTGTATGRWRRSSPTSTPAATTSTSRSRTGSTTSTSARSSAPRTRSWPPRCTSSATGAGTGAARWSPTATSTSSTTRTCPSLAAYLRDQPGGPVALWGIDNLPGSLHLETTEVPRRVCFLFGQEGPGLSDAGPRGLRRDVLDRPVRVDPVDQRLGRGRDRDARLGPRPRRPVRR